MVGSFAYPRFCRSLLFVVVKVVKVCRGHHPVPLPDDDVHDDDVNDDDVNDAKALPRDTSSNDLNNISKAL